MNVITSVDSPQKSVNIGIEIAAIIDAKDTYPVIENIMAQARKLN